MVIVQVWQKSAQPQPATGSVSASRQSRQPRSGAADEARCWRLSVPVSCPRAAAARALPRAGVGVTGTSPRAAPLLLPVGRTVRRALPRKIGCVGRDMRGRQPVALARDGQQAKARRHTRTQAPKRVTRPGSAAHRSGPPCGSCWASRTRAGSSGARRASSPSSSAAGACSPRRRPDIRAHCTSTWSRADAVHGPVCLRLQPTLEPSHGPANHLKFVAFFIFFPKLTNTRSDFRWTQRFGRCCGQ